jgi:alpha-L-fucosidase 2
MKKRHTPVIFIMILLGVIFLTNHYSLQASSTTHAFNTGTGTLNIDYAGYLSKHDLVFNQPITNPIYGATVGDGRVGAMVWNTNGLTMQITGVDNSQQTCFSSGLVNLYTNPGMDTGYSSFQQRLSLYDGLLTTKYDSNRTVTVMGSPNSEVMGIHVDDSRSGVSSITVDLSIWDLSGLTQQNNMQCDIPDINTWKTVSTYTDSNGAGLSRGQTDANHFGYTLAASVEGASFSTSVVNSSKVRLTITPTSSYTIWIANATRLNAPNYDSVTQAKNLLTSVKSTGYATTLTNYKNWWHNFWGKSFVQYSNSSRDADYMENVYYLSTYMIAGGGYATYPFHFINGAYSGMNDSDYAHWSAAYWYWNQRDVYNSFLASNHPDVIDGFYNLYSRNFNTIKSYTMTKYGIDGIWVPETMGWDGNARHTDESSYTNNLLSTGAEVGQNMYLRYKYTNDTNFLSTKAYPFMKEVCKFYSSKLSYDSGTGKYYMALSNCHETYWNVKNAITDLAAVRMIFPITIEASNILGLDSSLRSQWQNVLNNLVAYPADGSGYLPCAAPIPSRNNMENPTCELIWPYNVTGIGYSDYQTAVNTWNNRPCPYQNIWACDHIQAARLGMGDNCYNGMKLMLQNYQNYPNGRTSNTNGEFECIGLHLSAINEALLQSYNDKIRVFPALPSDTNFVSKFTLLAKGGFLVSSEKEANEIKYVGIKSLYGNQATIVNPWGTQQVQVRRVSDNAIVLTTSSSEFNVGTSANEIYVVERTAKPLSGYSYEQLTGTANQGVKSLSGTNSSLGSGPPIQSQIPGKVEAENYSAMYGIQVESCSDTGGGTDVGWIDAGDWMDYNVNVATTGSYNVEYRVASAGTTGQVQLRSGATVLATTNVPNTGGWQTWTSITATVNLNAGTQTLRLYAGGTGFNVNWMNFTSGGGNPTPTPTPTATPTPVPGGVTLDTCDSLTGWSSHNTLSLDTTNKQQGTGCLSETGAIEGQFWKSFGTAVNAGVTESSGYLEFEYYISDATKLSANNQIEISSSGTCDNNEYFWSMPTGLVNGWNHFKLKLSNAGKIGTPNLSAINWFRIYNFVTASVTAKIDNIRFTP